MNARQKAKYYKKRCERLEKLVLPVKRFPIEVNRSPIVTLRAEQIVETRDLPVLVKPTDDGFSILNKMMARQFLHQMLNYAEIETIREPYSLYSDKTLVRATMKIVDTRRCADEITE